MRRFAILIIWLAACHSPEKNLNPPDHNAEIRKCLIDEFNIKDYNYADLDSTLKYSNPPSKEVILYPGKFKLQKIEFPQPFNYAPFVVKVSDSSDSLIFLFTFTDELHYMYNDLQGDFDGRETITIFKPGDRGNFPSYKRDMETNLNSLIIKLGYQNNRFAIQQLLDAIFKDLLQMNPCDKYGLQHLNSVLSKVKTNDPRVKQSLEEYADLEEHVRQYFCVGAKEGELGFWQFKLEEENDVLKVKAHFIGDLFFYNIYM